jgi:hypothetical protein
MIDEYRFDIFFGKAEVMVLQTHCNDRQDILA